MENIISFKKANCRNCFKCLRECPVKAIAFKNEQAEILRDSCLVCGHCLTVCPQNAKQQRSDVHGAKELITGGRRVVASIAPAYAAAFSAEETADFEGSMKRLGFYAVRETAEGAAEVAGEYERLLQARKTSVLCSTACPTVVKLAQKYYPEVLPHLAAVVSPMTAHAKMLRRLYGEDAAVVFIGPCISKKDEAEWEDSGVDCVLTFEELRAWFDEAGTGDGSGGARRTEGPRQPARLFPTGGGILATMKRRLPGVSYLSVTGIERCREVFAALSEGKLHGFFLEMSACEGSCVGGPCMIQPEGGLMEAIRLVQEHAAGAGAEPGERPAVHLAPEELARAFRPNPVLGEMPGESAIREILAKTGKKTKQDELNCGACGYTTCRQKAIAVYQGKAELNMCMPYMRERAEMISDRVLTFTPNAIVVLDSFLNVQALNRAAVELFEIADSHDVRGKYIGELTDPSDFEEAIVCKQNILDRRLCLFRSDKYVEQSVIYVREHNMVFGIFKDLTESRRQEEKYERVKLDTIDTADRVLEKQMRIAQEIAMLLGESTAETKIALTRLKDTLASK